MKRKDNVISFRFFNKFIKIALYPKDELLLIKESNISKLFPFIYKTTRFPFGSYRKYIKGDTLNNYKDFDYGLTEYIKLLKLVHKQETKGFGRLNTYTLEGNFKYWYDYIWTGFRDDLDYCNKYSLLSHKRDFIHELFSKITHPISYEEEHNKVFHTIDSVILHGDPSGENVIIDENNKVNIIDWADALAGDYVYDIAFLATFYPKKVNFIIDTYNEFCTHFYKKFWLYYLRISLLKLAILHKRGYTDLRVAKERVNTSIENLCQM